MYKILATDTRFFQGIMAIVTVAIESNPRGEWKVYQGAVLIDNDPPPSLIQLIAGTGVKLPEALARAYFPQLDPTKAIY